MSNFDPNNTPQPYNIKLENLIAVSDDLVTLTSSTYDAKLIALITNDSTQKVTVDAGVTGIAVAAQSVAGVTIAATPTGLAIAETSVAGITVGATATGLTIAAASVAGVTIASTPTAISIAAVTAAGIDFTGVTHVGVNFTTATPTYGAYTSAGTGGRNNPFIKIGSWDDALAITQTTDHWVPIQVNITKSGDIAFDTAAMRLKVAMGTAHQPTSAIGCLQLRQTIAYNVASSCILNADVTVSGATTIQTGSLLGGYFSIQGAGAITKAGDNDCTVLTAVNNHTGGGIDNVAVFLQNGTGANVDEIVKIGVTNGTATAGLAFSGAMSKGINFAAATLNGTDNDDAFISIGSWDDAYVVGTHTTHYVPIQVHLHSNTSIAKDIAAMRLRVDTSAANTLNYVAVQEIRSSVSHNCDAIGTFGAGLSIDDNIAITTGEVVCGGFSIAGSGTITAAGANKATVLQACNWNTSATESVTHVAHFFQNGTGSTVRACLQLEAIAGTATTGLNIPNGTGTMLRAINIGASGTPLVCDTNDTKFVSIYTDCGATGGDNRGIYNRLYLTSTGGGESLRSYTDISGTVGTAHGAHISLGFGESTTTGAVTGLGAACRVTLGLANIAYPATGTIGVIDAEIYSFGANSDPAGNAIAIIRAGNNGDAGGQADVDDDAVLIALDGWTSATGNMVVKAASPGAMGNATWSVRCMMPDGSLAYLNFTAAAVTA